MRKAIIKMIRSNTIKRKLVCQSARKFESASVPLFEPEPQSRRPCLRGYLLLLLLAVGAGPDGGPAGPAIDDRQLPRIAATPADRAAQTFRVHPGLRVELVASEP